MSKMLNLTHVAWTTAQTAAKSGRRADALAQLNQLLAHPDLPAGVAADAHRLAAELSIELERFADARRHLRAAAGLQPKHSRTYYLAGAAAERGPRGDDRRAAVRFRKALELEPQNALYRAAFGRAAVRCDLTRRGTRELLAAAEAGADQPAVLRVVVDGLIEAGRMRTAHRVLVKARFLCPRSAEVRRLWERVRFETARLTQRKTRNTRGESFATGRTAVLPFVRLVGRTDHSTGGRTRRDVVSLPRPHFARLAATLADR